MVITSNGPQNVGQIRKQFSCGNLFLSPEEYQRENAWRLQQKQLLIDTIFLGMDIPKFYLWKIDHKTLTSPDGYTNGGTKSFYIKLLERKRVENDDSDPYIYEVVDGQQRIRTMLEFMGENPPNNKCFRGLWHAPFPSLNDTPMAKGKYYAQLNADQQTKFDERSLTVMILENATIHEIRDMFTRLQNGSPLNAQQKRDAMGSTIGRIARELAERPFFRSSVHFENTNSAHNFVASQMLLLEWKEKIASCTSPQMDKLYSHFKTISFDPVVVSRTKNIIDILGKVFPQKNPHLNQNYALSLYWLLSRMLLNYAIPPGQYIKIRENFERLDIARTEAMTRDYNQAGDDKYESLSLAMSRGNTGVDGISVRHDIIGQHLFESVQFNEYPNLDPKRNFTHEEKLILFHRAKELCQLEYSDKVCGRQLEFDEAVIDHIVPHSKGGKTTIENGRIAHRSCNNARGNRDDFNPATACHLLTPVEIQHKKI